MLALALEANIPMLILVLALVLGALATIVLTLHYGRRLSATVKGVSFELSKSKNDFESIIEQTVGTTNEAGNVTAMLEKVLLGQRAHSEQLHVIETLLSAHALRLAAGSERFIEIERRLDHIEDASNVRHT